MSTRIDPIEESALPRIDPDKLREARGNRTATSVVAAVRISRQHLWQSETGKRAPGSEVLAKLCWLYDIDISALTTTNGKRKVAA